MLQSSRDSSSNRTPTAVVSYFIVFLLKGSTYHTVFIPITCQPVLKCCKKVFREFPMYEYCNVFNAVQSSELTSVVYVHVSVILNIFLISRGNLVCSEIPTERIS